MHDNAIAQKASFLRSSMDQLINMRSEGAFYTDQGRVCGCSEAHIEPVDLLDFWERASRRLSQIWP
jgi:hypothetical protein